MILPHVDSQTAPPSITEDSPLSWCCYGEAFGGPTSCTCWEPVYDLEQAPLQNGGKPPEELPTRKKCCHDCAFRVGSPEREREDAVLEEALEPGHEFWCHQGVRRIVAWEHPDGRRVEAPPGCYVPPQGPPERPVVWKADGTVGERCAGWAAHGKGART